jgi:hypothetical protein
MVVVDPDDASVSQPGGKPPRQDSEGIIIRNLQQRVSDLETRLARAQSITFVSPDGATLKTLGIDNSGNPVWT